MAQKRKEITSYREIERIVEIHEQISSGKYPTTGKLAELLECSTSTISETLNFFVTVFMLRMNMIPQNADIIIQTLTFSLNLKL